jgi:hypothetical protein
MPTTVADRLGTRKRRAVNVADLLSIQRYAIPAPLE